MGRGEKRVTERELIRELVQRASNEFIGLAAYLETCDPVVIVENLSSLAASLRRRAAELREMAQTEEARERLL